MSNPFIEVVSTNGVKYIINMNMIVAISVLDSGNKTIYLAGQRSDGIPMSITVPAEFNIFSYCSSASRGV